MRANEFLAPLLEILWHWWWGVEFGKLNFYNCCSVTVTKAGSWTLTNRIGRRTEEKFRRGVTGTQLWHEGRQSVTLSSLLPEQAGRFLKWDEGGVDWGVGLEGGLVGCPPLAGAVCRVNAQYPPSASESLLLLGFVFCVSLCSIFAPAASVLFLVPYSFHPCPPTKYAFV